MIRNDFSDNLIEKMIFNEWKDIGLKNSEYLRMKYHGLDIDFSKLYRKIINYQIKTYGTSLNSEYIYKSKEENRRISNNAFKRKEKRRRR